MEKELHGIQTVWQVCNSGAAACVWPSYNIIQVVWCYQSADLEQVASFQESIRWFKIFQVTVKSIFVWWGIEAAFRCWFAKCYLCLLTYLLLSDISHGPKLVFIASYYSLKFFSTGSWTLIAQYAPPWTLVENHWFVSSKSMSTHSMGVNVLH